MDNYSEHDIHIFMQFCLICMRMSQIPGCQLGHKSADKMKFCQCIRLLSICAIHGGRAFGIEASAGSVGVVDREGSSLLATGQLQRSNPGRQDPSQRDRAGPRSMPARPKSPEPSLGVCFPDPMIRL